MELNAETALHQNPEQVFLRGNERLRLVIDTIPVLAWCHRVDGLAFTERDLLEFIKS